VRIFAPPCHFPAKPEPHNPQSPLFPPVSALSASNRQSYPLGTHKTHPPPHAHSSKSARRRAGATGGGFGSNPMCINIFSITPRSSMTAMSFSLARVLRPFDAQSSADLMTGIRQAIQRSDRPELE